MILEKILEKERRLRALHLQLQHETFYIPFIIEKFSAYLDDYCAYTGLTWVEVLVSYNNFVRTYVEDLRAFESTGLYPIQRGEKRAIDRQDYDLALILSVFFEKVRHRIFSNIYCSYKSLEGNEHLLYIGLGPGLELDLLDKPAKVDAYDTIIAPFVQSRFSQYNLVEELFIERKNYYERIYCIEIFEHVLDPEKLLKNMAVSLIPGGILYFTTASDMPQFDHLVNFTGVELSAAIKESGLMVLEQTNLWHDYKKAHNTWYTCKKL
jgi:hypothetical protein